MPAIIPTVSDDEASGTLNELAAHLRPVFESLDGGVYLYLDARRKVCNEQLARMYGRTVEEWSSVEDFQETFVAEDDRPAYCDIYGRTVRRFDWPSPYRFRGLRSDGSTFQAEALVVPLTFKGRTFAYHFVRALPEAAAPQPFEDLIDRYNRAWNEHDVDAIAAMHTPDMVFENRSLGERAEGEQVRSHIAAIFENWPGLALLFGSRHVSGDVIVQEWTLTATHRATGKPAEWDGVDLITVTDGLIARKVFYSGSAAARQRLLAPVERSDPP